MGDTPVADILPLFILLPVIYTQHDPYPCTLILTNPICVSMWVIPLWLLYHPYYIINPFNRFERLERETSITEEDKDEAIRLFESNCQNIKHAFCICCHMVGLTIKVNRKGFCPRCARLSKDPNHFANKQMLPIWRKDGQPMYHVPIQLACLRDAEKMLIQRISPFVPLHHIKGGVMGLRGHVCAFEQDISEFVNTLPRSVNDVSLIRVVKVMQAEIGSGVAKDLTYIVRKSNVLEALTWLKKYNPLYSDITIDPSQLDWISGEEAELQCHSIGDNEENQCRSVADDLGPNPTFYDNTTTQGDNISCFGYIDTGGKVAMSDVDQEINNCLQTSVAASPNKKSITVDWPAIKDNAVSEYGNKKIFALAFPWLFPGKYIGVKLQKPIDYPYTNHEDVIPFINNRWRG